MRPSSVGRERSPVPMAELMHKGSWASGRHREGGKNVSSRRNSISKGSLVGKLGLWEESVGLEGRRPEGGGKYEAKEERVKEHVWP